MMADCQANLISFSLAHGLLFSLMGASGMDAPSVTEGRPQISSTGMKRSGETRRGMPLDGGNFGNLAGA